LTEAATAPEATAEHRPGQAVLRWGGGTALVSLAVLVVVLFVGGGAPQPVPAGLPDPGPLTGWGLPVARLLADLAAMATIGLLLAAALLIPSPADRLADVAARGVRLATRVALVWGAAVVIEIVFSVSEFLGVTPDKALDPTLLLSFVTEISQGRALLVQAALVVAVAGLGRAVINSRGAAVIAALAVGALLPPVLTGHSATAGSHDLAVASLMVHVVGAALWVGGLAALAWAGLMGTTAAGTDGLRHAVPRFSTLAAWCFAAVALSGVVNAAVRLGAVAPLVTSSYGVLVLAKVAALGILGGFGYWHRRRTVAQLAAGASAVTGRREATRAFLVVAAAELGVMTATVALAVGLSRTPTPSSGEVASTPAQDLLGFALPAAPTAYRVVFGWAPDGFALTFLALAGALYAVGVLSMHRRGHRWPLGRIVSWYAGLAVFAWATVGGLGLYSQVLFSAHMIAHMLLSMVAPIGLVLGAPVTLALRTLPGQRGPDDFSPRQLLTAALHSGPARLLTHPLVALALFVGGFYGLYFTGAFPALMSSYLGHVAMEFHFLAVGFLFFSVVLGVDPLPRRLPAIARVGLLFAAMPFHAFFSITIMSGQTVLAGDYFAALDRPYWTDLLDDQHLGGGIGWAMGELPIVFVLLALFAQWVRSDAREASRFDRAADRAASRAEQRGAGGEPAADDALGQYNAYLAQLAARDDSAQLGDGKERRR